MKDRTLAGTSVLALGNGITLLGVIRVLGLDGAADLSREMIERGVLPSDVAVWAADADAAFVRPGPRLVNGIEALASIAHPEVVPPRPDVVRQVR